GSGSSVPCLTGFPLSGPACAFALQSLLTVDPTAVGNPFVSPAQLVSRAFVVNQFEKNGGGFPFPIRQHEGSAPLGDRFTLSDSAFLPHSFAHLEESDPDVQALIGFSRGTSVLNWDSTLQARGFINSVRMLSTKPECS